METPKPVDLSLLSGVLAKSRQVMSKIDWLDLRSNQEEMANLVW